MNHLGYVAMLSVLGGLIGVFACIADWTPGNNGFDLLESSADLQVFIPIMVLILSVIVVLLSITYTIRPWWFIPLIIFFLGVAILILTSLFAMWTIDGSKVVTDKGVWTSYISGAVIMVASAAIYKRQFGTVPNGY